MGCQIIGNAIICSRGTRNLVKCSVGLCGKPSVALCDYPVERYGKPATCDAPMCKTHRHPGSGNPDTDWCESHWNYEQRQETRGGYSRAEQA